MRQPRVAAPEPDRGVRLERETFERLAEPLIPALRLHCYRLVGSLDDAEDMVQEALVRGWRRRDRLEDPSGARPWLYRIATNACLDLLDGRRRRPTAAFADELGWPDPVPETWLAGGAGGDPAESLLQQEKIGLAFLTAVQVLPPRQRAILILRDVLEWPAADVAEALGTTAVAVNSGLQRARATIRQHLPGHGPEPSTSVVRAEARDVAQRYLDAWERTDVAGLADLLATDARMAMPPDPRLFEGPAAIIHYFEWIFGQPPEQRIRLVPTSANGGPAFIVVGTEPTPGVRSPIGLKVLTIHHRRITEIRGYMRADLAARFGDVRA